MANGLVYNPDTIRSNIVSDKSLKVVQGSVLRMLKSAIEKSLGPAGSNTLILKGNSDASLVAEYTKDGHNILKNIKFQNPIEMSIQSDIEEITRHVEATVGDGTSTAVILSSLIFDRLTALSTDENPFEIIRSFKKAVEEIKKEILSHGHECTLEDIYHIALISTNNNEEIASSLRDIYKEYGMNVFIDVSASTDGNSYLRDYDGLTLDVGYSDSAYINTPEGASYIQHPRVYVFKDPIDAPNMVAFFEKIISENIWNPVVSRNRDAIVPTVILAPKISRDMTQLLIQLTQLLHQFPATQSTQKPPILIVTNIFGMSADLMTDIAALCGAKLIINYIDPKNEKIDQEKGLAPTVDNVVDFSCGTCEAVEADASKTKFINPSKMYQKDENGEDILDENGRPIPAGPYKALLEDLEVEIKRAYRNSESAGTIGGLKRRLNALKANMVEYVIGGVAISDRDSLRDLVEDAVLNCRSAAQNGVGYAANFEGFHASKKLAEKETDLKMKEYYSLIHEAYAEFIRILYSISIPDKEFCDKVLDAVDNGHSGPYNISTKSFDGKVLTAINTDPIIMDTIAKIVTLMFTCNQALVQAPNLNIYG